MHLKKFKLNSRKTILFLIDVLIIIFAYYFIGLLAVAKKDITMITLAFTFSKLFWLIVLTMSLRIFFNIYKSVWRYADIKTYIKLIISDILAGIIYIVIGRIFKQINIGAAYSLIIILFVIVITLFSRFVYQYLYAKKNAKDEDVNNQHKINVAIVGAGNIGASLASEMLRNPRSNYFP